MENEIKYGALVNIWEFLQFKECYQLLQSCQSIHKIVKWYQNVVKWKKLVDYYPLIDTAIEFNLVTVNDIIKESYKFSCNVFLITMFASNNKAFVYLKLKTITWEELIKMDIHLLDILFDVEMNHYFLCAWKLGILTLQQFQTIPIQDLYDIFSLWSNAFESMVKLETTFDEHILMRRNELIIWNKQYSEKSSLKFRNWARQLHDSNSLEQ
jgi:hypothetical protein